MMVYGSNLRAKNGFHILKGCKKKEKDGEKSHIWLAKLDKMYAIWLL